MVNPIRFNVDLTGVNPNNRVDGELHSLPNKINRSIATTYGPYFTDTLEVFDATTGARLVRDIHYKCLDVVGLPTAQSGKEICTVVVVTNPSVSNLVRLNYQALGGGYERTYEAIRMLMDTLLNDARPINWPSVLNRPSDFNPSHHLHRVGDAIGFEYMVSELERLKAAVLMGDETAHVEILAYVDMRIDGLRQLLEDTQYTITLLAVTGATDANNSATAALSQVNMMAQDIDTINAAIDSIAAEMNAIFSMQASSESDAIALIQQYS